MQQQIDLDRLRELKERINSEWRQAGDHLVNAAKHLAEAKCICKANGKPFKEWCEKNIVLRYPYANKLALAGQSADPQKAIEDMRSSTAQRVKAHREKSKGMVLRNTIDPIEDEDVGGSEVLKELKLLDDGEVGDDKEILMTVRSLYYLLLDERKAALEGRRERSAVADTLDAVLHEIGLTEPGRQLIEAVYGERSPSFR